MLHSTPSVAEQLERRSTAYGEILTSGATGNNAWWCAAKS